MSKRADLKLITRWTPQNARVLDLGCGDGTLLALLAAERSATGYGIEIDTDRVADCIERGVDVIQRDLDGGLADFADDSFDVVLMTLALQAVARPDLLLQEMVRVGKTAIITFPNFGHWRARWGLAAGRMPTSDALPHTWYSTPNIHLCTVDDFEQLCADLGLTIKRSSMIRHNRESSWLGKRMPNLLGEVAVYQVSKSTE